ncbi:glycosyltransferase [Neptuniibacter sp. PT34_22]|uniref:glycosyltransferase n=1 Tax=Neptuniibacter sp. PT34_22 TaxID=3398205 RepID=UPI0039F4CCA2
MKLKNTRKKVCFFLPHFFSGGLEKVVLNLINNLNQDLYEPCLLLLDGNGDLLPRLNKNVAVFDLGGAKSSSGVFQLVSELNKINPDIVYAGTHATNLMLLLAKAFVKDHFYTIISEHTPLALLLSESKYSKIRVLLMRCLYRYADVFVAPVPEICTEHREILHLPEMPVKSLCNPVIPNVSGGLDKHARPEIFDRLTGPICIAVGRLAAEKQFDLLIDSFARVLETCPEANLLILGEGAERSSLEDKIRQLNLTGKVHLIGNVENPFIYYPHCTLLLSCSKREGFGNVLVEAMSEGVPVVSMDCPFGPRNIIEDKRSGLLVPLNDENAFTEAIQWFLSNPQLHEQYSQAAKQISKAYTVSNAAEQFEEVCASLHC